MKLTELKLRNFTVFESADFTFAPGINVFIGENATGKSHALKVVYALLKAARAHSMNPEEELKNRLAAIFRPDDKDVGRLVRGGADGPSTLWIKADSNETFASLSEPGDVTVTRNHWHDVPDALYLPARDVLSMYEGFVALYERADLSFDATYYDACVSLQSPSRHGDAKIAADQLAAPFLSLLGGEVQLRGPRFYVDLGDGLREAHLVAEGLRKLAALAHLAGNGSIQAEGILLWDEPETNLNPRLIAPLADALRRLAASGVQIFIATHDFLLAHRLSLAAEYETAPKVDMQFFSLYRETLTVPVEVESAPLVTRLQNNPILEAYAQYYDDQRELYNQELKRELGTGAP
jgi:predicted ATPase